jgi:hypothetical protein
MDYEPKRIRLEAGPNEKGMDFHLANDAWWPLDDEDNLLPDWHLDQNQF